ncbi:MAG: hypothetical protein GY729_21195 [Desulfobacteraceae bacterium]|nr:hypothetical protein [Desulfobacteraceae bacterium]
MEKILNITNGDATVPIMKEANIPGEFLPWRDVLHDGPVPQTDSLDALSQIRAQFIFDQGWGPLEEIKQGFIERDTTLKSLKDYEKIVLWFEHDLYDQLQILQILDWFSQNRLVQTRLSMICTNQYLGMISPEKMTGLFKYEEPVTDHHLALSKNAWSAFRSSSPEKWFDLLKTDTSTLPFLSDAVLRLLEEYPSCTNGLSLTAQKALDIISGGEKNPGKVFKRYQTTEEKMFMGDYSFWAILNEFIAAPDPLLELSGGGTLPLAPKPDLELTITQTGKSVLSGQKNWMELTNIDHWIGGVHLTPDNLWCWDAAMQTLVEKS